MSKHVLPSSVAENQMALAANRPILYAYLIANEVIDVWNLSHKEGVVLKLDLEKAFDKVDWDFLDVILLAKGFGHRWRKRLYLYCQVFYYY